MGFWESSARWTRLRHNSTASARTSSEASSRACQSESIFLFYIHMRRMCRQGQEPAASESDSKPSSSSFVCAGGGGGGVNRTCQRSREPRDQRARLKLRSERRPYKAACLHQLLTPSLSAAEGRAAGPSRVGPSQAEISR